MDATTQFEDINHSEKAANIMKDLYIGDFKNAEEEKESWEQYQQRKKKEEEG
jgi:cytochrome b involved in lipid metabolism